MSGERVTKNVLVTGAAGGMCRGINARLADAGYRVLCADVSEDGVNSAVEGVQARGGLADGFVVDVVDDESIHALSMSLSDNSYDVHALVNAAGVLDRKSISDHDSHSFERVLDVNLSGPFRMIKSFSSAMVDRGWGRIVNISSIAGVTGYPDPGYAASKAGLSNLARSLTIDFWGTGVTVNSICPGIVDTPMVGQRSRGQILNRIPTESIVDPEEIGGFVVFLLGDDARNINGADLLMDGGATRFFSSN